MRRMDEEGHQVGIHTFDHVKLTDLSRTDFDAPGGDHPGPAQVHPGPQRLLLRPPYGMLDESVKAWAGCPIILWSIDPGGLAGSEHRPGGAGGGGRGQRRRNHPDARHLPRVGGRRPPDCRPAPPAGYLFCTVDELFAARGLPLGGRGNVLERIPINRPWDGAAVPGPCRSGQTGPRPRKSRGCSPPRPPGPSRPPPWRAAAGPAASPPRRRAEPGPAPVRSPPSAASP